MSITERAVLRLLFHYEWKLVNKDNNLHIICGDQTLVALPASPDLETKLVTIVQCHNEDVALQRHMHERQIGQQILDYRFFLRPLADQIEAAQREKKLSDAGEVSLQ